MSADDVSWQARLVGVAIKVLIRREHWGSERALARRARRVFGAPRPYGWLRTRGVTIRASAAAGVRGEWVQAAPESGSVILYIHGGGFVCCSAATHRPITAQLARLTRCRVFAADYRLAPEHRYPAALDDVMTAYRHLIHDVADPASLAVAGDSAGGGLTLSLMLRARDEGLPLPACGVCFSPWVDLSAGSPSVQRNNGRCAMFRPRNMPDFAGTYLGDTPPSAPYASPVLSALVDLPPLLLQVGAPELLLDDAVRTHEKIRAAGGDSELEIYSGMFHGWHMLDGIVPEAHQALQRAAVFIRRHVC